MEKIRVFLLDDEEHVRKSQRKILQSYCPEAEVVGEAGSVEEGITRVNELQPAVVLLDIRLGDGTAFDFLRNWPVIPFKVIFVTAYNEFALRAFKFSAVDYLLKPVHPSDLIEALDRAGKLLREQHTAQMKALEDHLSSDPMSKKKIVFRTADKIYVVDLKNIVSCESDSNYTRIHTSDGETILVTRTLKDYEEILEEHGFFRVHKSFLVNFDHIRQFDKQDGGYLVLSNKHRVPVSSRRREELLRKLEDMAK